MAELTDDQGEAILHARRLMFAWFQQRWPDDAASLYATACLGGLLDVLYGANVRPDMLEMINRQLVGSPFQLERRLTN
jgi:hypothetical protein